MQRGLDTEFTEMTDALTRFSYGILSQRMKTEHSKHSSAMQKKLTAMKVSFNHITDAPLQRVCYVGTDAWFEGIACARHIGQKLRTGGSLIIVVTSSLDALVMSQRYRSFVHTLTKEYPRVQIIDMFEAHADQERARAYVASKAKNIDAVYVTGNSVVSGVAQGVADAGVGKNVFVLCHDLDTTIVQKMHEGLVSASVVCSTYAQGHDAVIHLYNSIAAGWKPFQPRLMQKLKTVTLQNIDEYWDAEASEPQRRAGIHNTGVKPVGVPNAEKTRILFLCEDWNATFCQIMSGAEKAKDELAPFGCEVIIHVLNQMKRSQKEVLAEAKAVIDKEMKKGLAGIAAFVGFAEMVPLLNSCAEKGIKIASFNSEPLSLRAMIEWLMLSTSQLGLFARDYSAGLADADSAQQRILGSLSTIVERSGIQQQAINDGANSIGNLTDIIKRTAEQEQIQTQTMQETAAISGQLSDLVSFFDNKVKDLRSMGDQVRKSAAKTDAIKAYSEKIESIVGIIDGITEQTNLLAFNAAVESTHAGEWGKGFKVISAEIRSLADKSVESTGNISNLITDMHKAVQEGINANTNTLEIVNEQVKAMTNAGAQLAVLSKKLLEAIDKVQNTVNVNAAGYREMRNAASGINQVMDKCKDIAAENTTTLEQINQSFSQINSQFKEMSSQTGRLSELITIMEGTVSSFSA
ncbi:MAG: methyl-accepting chemotaxis protein [Bacteroides sp.]|nr:methyl-accepting chemotaxis protein [Prevotella sp.]MCM1407952.1 methyl-accepting chemotaxis protein [Treponema brennaborense]MCM1469694.1 methyl-accepting chemotaxis protein [Bacteroides sp.]